MDLKQNGELPLSVEDVLIDPGEKDEKEDPFSIAAEPTVLKKDEEAQEKANTVQSFSNTALYMKIVLAAAVSVGPMCSGMAGGYTAVLLPQLRRVNGSLYTDEEMGSWIGSIQMLGQPIGGLLGSFLMQVIGRQRTQILQPLTIILAWISTTCAWNHVFILLGRSLAGVSLGLWTSVLQIFVAEVTDPKMRDWCSPLPVVSYSVGVLLVYILGLSMHWRLVAGLCIIPAIISVVLFCFIHDSPVWLLRRGLTEKARRACLWYRGNNVEAADKEMEQLAARTKRDQERKEESKMNYCTRSILTPLFIVVAFYVLQALSGWHLLVLFAVDIIQSMLGESMDPKLTVILTAVVRVIFVLVGLGVYPNLGRRTVGVYFPLGCGVSAAVLALCLLFNVGKSWYLVHFLLLVYVGAVTIGFMSFGGILAGELFPVRVRAQLASVRIILSGLFFYCTTKLFPFFKHHCGIHGIFFIFAAASGVGALLMFLMMPETKGMTLGEIEDYFEQNIFWFTRKKGTEVSKEEIPLQAKESA